MVQEQKIVEVAVDKAILNVQSVMDVEIIFVNIAEVMDHTLVDIVMVLVKKIVVNISIILQE